METNLTKIQDKSESIDEEKLSSIMKMIIELCHENERGITEKTLQIAMNSVSALDRAHAVNKLLSANKIEICKQGTQLLYRLKQQTKSIGSDEEERIVYTIIEKAGNKGIWIRDIRFQSNISQTQLNKVLKNMENQKLIKSVKSVAASKKKVFMLASIEPDRSVTGGSWYNGPDYESEFIDVLAQQCHRCLSETAQSAKATQTNPLLRRNSSFLSSTDVLNFIKELRISRVELSIEDIESILNTLVSDGKVEKYVKSNMNNAELPIKLYRAIESLANDTGLMRMPCGLCPVYNECYEGGPICPSKCVYIKKWLES